MFQQNYTININLYSSISQVKFIKPSNAFQFNKTANVLVNYASLGEPSCALLTLQTSLIDTINLGFFGTSLSTCLSIYNNSSVLKKSIIESLYINDFSKMMTKNQTMSNYNSIDE